MNAIIEHLKENPPPERQKQFFETIAVEYQRDLDKLWGKAETKEDAC